MKANPNNIPAPRINWPTERIEQRLDTLERMLAMATTKELPTLNHCIEVLINELVMRDSEQVEP